MDEQRAYSDQLAAGVTPGRAPPKSVTGGDVKSASSSRYSQYPANSRLEPAAGAQTLRPAIAQRQQGIADLGLRRVAQPHRLGLEAVSPAQQAERRWPDRTLRYRPGGLRRPRLDFDRAGLHAPDKPYRDDQPLLSITTPLPNRSVPSDSCCPGIGRDRGLDAHDRLDHRRHVGRLELLQPAPTAAAGVPAAHHPTKPAGGKVAELPGQRRFAWARQRAETMSRLLRPRASPAGS